MDYTDSAAKVVGGGSLALFVKTLFESTVVPNGAVAVLYGLLFLGGAFVAVSGLFEGVEAAVEAGRESGSEE